MSTICKLSGFFGLFMMVERNGLAEKTDEGGMNDFGSIFLISAFLVQAGKQLNTIGNAQFVTNALHISFH
jgi:hypothetical protein